MAGATSATRELGRVLVTGGAGFIGSAISHLLEGAEEIVAFDNLHPQVHSSQDRPANLHESVQLVIGDITSPTDWDDLLQSFKPDTVIHLAAETGTGQSLSESSRHANVNVVGTTQMLDAFRRNNAEPKRIVLTSSRAVYGEGAWENEAGELSYPGQRSVEQLNSSTWDFPGLSPVAMQSRAIQPAPVSIYAATKLAQEHIIRVWASSFEIEAVILRLQNVYGPGQSLINPYTGIMSLFCRMAMSGKAIPLYEDGEVRRDFILIDDVASAVVVAARIDTPPKDVIDIGLGEMHTISDAAHLIAEEYQAPAPYVTGKYRLGDVRHAWANVEDANQELGWQPKHSLKQGIHALVSWINEQPDVEPA